MCVVLKNSWLEVVQYFYKILLVSKIVKLKTQEPSLTGKKRLPIMNAGTEYLADNTAD